MKKLFLYLSLYIMAFWSGYLISHEKYKDYHYDYEINDAGAKQKRENDLFGLSRYVYAFFRGYNQMFYSARVDIEKYLNEESVGQLIDEQREVCDDIYNLIRSK